MRYFPRRQKRLGTIHADINDNDPAILCSALAQGLTSGVSMELDHAGARRLWFLYFPTCGCPDWQEK